MAGWISSKLKVAETFLQQIDQQAAESLGHSEKLRSPTDSSSPRSEIPKRNEASLPIKYQLPKRSPPSPPLDRNPLQHFDLGSNTSNLQVVRASLPTKADPALSDGDWTQLLSSPEPVVNPIARPGGRTNYIRGSNKLGAPVSAGEKAGPKLGIRSGVVAKGDGAQAPDISAPLSSESSSDSTLIVLDDGRGETSASGDGTVGDFSLGSGSDRAGKVRAAGDDVRSGREGVSPPEAVPVVRDDLGRNPSESDGTDTNSASSTDSEEEEQRRREERRIRREQKIAEKVSAAAIRAIKEREGLVAKLEGEKQSLEKILEEREKQQAQEASELQTSMIETMEAVEVEKQKHNSTRMEALARLAKLETENVELAKALAKTQWNLDVEVNNVAKIRQQVELKELAQEEYKKRLSDIHLGAPLGHIESSKRDELEKQLLDAEQSFTCEKIARLKKKVEKLEENIELTKMQTGHPTELEVELKKRLAQLTDHLIQKQTQVEALFAEKATLSFRIEAISRLLDENGSSLQAVSSEDLGAGSANSFSRVDLELGTWLPSNSAGSSGFQDRMRSGKRQLRHAIGQLDDIFSLGATLLKRNPVAQMWGLVYLCCLHLWVLYILMSHSQVSDTSSNGEVFSIETINRTSA